MKLNKLLFPSLLLSATLAHGQQVPPNAAPEDPEARSQVSSAPIIPEPGEVEPAAPPFNGGGENVPVGAPALPGEGELPDVPPPPPPVPEGEEGVEGELPAAGPQIEEADGGLLIQNAALNDIFQMLATRADKQYFHNTRVAGPEYSVNGRLNGGDPLQQMEELAFMYGLTLYTKGDTVYALNNEQLNQLPASEWHYQLRYLRPTDIEQIKALIQPMLSPTGIANYEPKTNTIIIIDSAHQVERARSLLTTVDKAKGQVVVEVKILSINSSVGERVGVDWSSSLGASGVPLETIGSLNSLFGISNVTAAAGTTSGRVLSGSDSTDSAIVLSPVQINGVLRALADGGLVTQTSNPTLITEDNEQATISLIDRVPIITTTINETEVSNQVTEEVRYSVDQSDPVGDPATTREIGVTVAVTPQLLPDGTIRMKMRPRSAQIVEEIIGQSGNKYPRVSESMIESITRIPDGHSLVVGGFYGQVKQDNRNKVPLLGDIPIINFFFKSKDAAKETSSLVFVVTPTSYNPGSVKENCDTAKGLRRELSLKPGHDSIEPTLPGAAHVPNLPRTMRDLHPAQRDHAPSAEELQVELEGCCDDGQAKSGMRRGRLGFPRKR